MHSSPFSRNLTRFFFEQRDNSIHHHQGRSSWRERGRSCARQFVHWPSPCLLPAPPFASLRLHRLLFLAAVSCLVPSFLLPPCPPAVNQLSPQRHSHLAAAAADAFGGAALAAPSMPKRDRERERERKKEGKAIHSLSISSVLLSAPLFPPS